MAQHEHETSNRYLSRSFPCSLGNYIQLRSGLSRYSWLDRCRRVRLREPEEVTQTDFFTLYFASLAVVGGLSGFVITHLLSEIKRLHARVDEIYNILLER